MSTRHNYYYYSKSIPYNQPYKGINKPPNKFGSTLQLEDADEDEEDLIEVPEDSEDIETGITSISEEVETDNSIEDEQDSEDSSSEVATRQLSYASLPSLLLSDTGNNLAPDDRRKKSLSASPALSFDSVAMELEDDEDFEMDSEKDEIDDSPTQEEENSSQEYVNVNVRVEKEDYALYSNTVKVTVKVQPPSEAEDDTQVDYGSSESVESKSENESGSGEDESDDGDGSQEESERTGSEDQSESDQTGSSESDQDEEESEEQGSTPIKKKTSKEVKTEKLTKEKEEILLMSSDKVQDLLSAAIKDFDKPLEKVSSQTSTVLNETKDLVVSQVENTVTKDIINSSVNAVKVKAQDVKNEVERKLINNEIVNSASKQIEKVSTTGIQNVNNVEKALSNEITAVTNQVEKYAANGIEKANKAGEVIKSGVTEIENVAKTEMQKLSPNNGVKKVGTNVVNDVLNTNSANNKRLSPDAIQQAVVNKIQATVANKTPVIVASVLASPMNPKALKPNEPPLPLITTSAQVHSKNVKDELPKNSQVLGDKTLEKVIIVTSDKIVDEKKLISEKTKIEDKKSTTTKPSSEDIKKPQEESAPVVVKITPVQEKDDKGDAEDYLSIYADSMETSDEDDDENTIQKQIKVQTEEEIKELEKAKDKLIEDWKLNIKEEVSDLDEKFSHILEDMVTELREGPVEAVLPPELEEAIKDRPPPKEESIHSAGSKDGSEESVNGEEMDAINSNEEEPQKEEVLSSRGSLESHRESSSQQGSNDSLKEKSEESLRETSANKILREKEALLIDDAKKNSERNISASNKLVSPPLVKASSPGAKILKSQSPKIQRPVPTTPMPIGTIVAKPIGITGPKPVGAVIKPVGTIETKPVGTIVTKPATISKPVATTVTKPVGTIAPKPVGTIAPKPVGTTVPKSVQTKTKAVGTIAAKPVGTIATKPVETIATKPVGTIAPKPVGTTKAFGTTIAPKPVTTNETKPIGTTVPKSVQTKTKAVGTVATKPVGTTIPKPIGTTDKKTTAESKPVGTVCIKTNSTDDKKKETPSKTLPSRASKEQILKAPIPPLRKPELAKTHQSPGKVLEPSTSKSSPKSSTVDIKFFESEKVSLKVSTSISKPIEVTRNSSEESLPINQSIDDENGGILFPGDDEEEEDLPYAWNDIPSEEKENDDDEEEEEPEKRRKWNNSTEIASTLSHHLHLIKTETVEYSVSEIIPLLTELLTSSRKNKSEHAIPTMIATLSAVRVFCERLLDVKAESGEKALKNMDLSWLLRILCKISADADSKLRKEASFTLAKLVIAAGPVLITRPIYFLLVMENEGYGHRKGAQGSKTKAAALDTLTYALLTFPKEEFEDLEEIARWVCLVVFHNHRRVRQSALECISVIATRLGNPDAAIAHFRRFITREAEAQFIPSDSDDSNAGRKKTFGTTSQDIFDVLPITAISSRVRRRVLPVPSPYGLIEFGVKVPVGQELILILTKLQEREEEAFEISTSDNASEKSEEISFNDDSEMDSIRMSDLERAIEDDEEDKQDKKPIKPPPKINDKDLEFSELITPDVAYILAGKGRVSTQEYKDDEMEENLKKINELMPQPKSLINKKHKKCHKKRKHKKRHRHSAKKEFNSDSDSFEEKDYIF